MSSSSASSSSFRVVARPASVFAARVTLWLLSEPRAKKNEPFGHLTVHERSDRSKTEKRQRRERASKFDERARDASRDDDANARERPRSGWSTIGGEPDASTFDGETTRAERVVVVVVVVVGE